MKAIIGKKVGMTSYIGENGRAVACTIIEAGPCAVTQLRTQDKDGYTAVQLGFGDVKEKHTNKALTGHFKKSNTSPKAKVMEVRNCSLDLKTGDVVNCDIFKEGETVNVIGTSIGKGFQGVVKRHGFSGVGSATHGQHNRLRAPGSIGACSTPSRVFKGMRMAGRLGGVRVKVQNLKVLKVYADKNLLVISGAIPGHDNGYVMVESK